MNTESNKQIYSANKPISNIANYCIELIAALFLVKKNNKSA